MMGFNHNRSSLLILALVLEMGFLQSNAFVVRSTTLSSSTLAMASVVEEVTTTKAKKLIPPHTTEEIMKKKMVGDMYDESVQKTYGYVLFFFPSSSSFCLRECH